MPKWFYKDADRENGPVETSELKHLARSGKLRPSDAVRRDDMKDWTQANRIKGLFGTDSEPSVPLASEGAANPQAAPSKMATSDTTTTSQPEQPVRTGYRIMATMKQAAVLAAKHAQLKTLSWDVNRADEATGFKAHSSLIGKHFADIYDRISQIEQEVAVKRKAEPVPPNESMSDKAKRIAYEAQKKVAVESLLSERKKYLRDLGERLRTSGDSTATKELLEELTHARQAQSKVESMKKEIDALSQHSPKLLRKAGLVAALLAVMLICYLGYGFFTSTNRSVDQNAALSAIASNVKQSDDHKAALAALESKTKADRDKIKAEMAETERKRELDAAERDARQKLDADKQALELEQRKAVAESKAKEKEMARQEKEQRRRLDSAAQAASAQIDRKRLADDLFGGIVLDPTKSVQLSKTLKQSHKATVELRGRKYTEIAALHANRNWLELTNLLTGISYNELPDASSLESAAKSLLSYEFTMLVKTTATLNDNYDGPSLHRISFPLHVGPIFSHVIDDSTRWERHPDGIGYFHKWTPSNGYSVVVLATKNTVSSKVRQLNEEVRSKTDELKTKLKLGEIDEATLQQTLAETVSRVYNDAATWATGM
jgi:hypothetical protein